MQWGVREEGSVRTVGLSLYLSARGAAEHSPVRRSGSEAVQEERAPGGR